MVEKKNEERESERPAEETPEGAQTERVPEQGPPPQEQKAPRHEEETLTPEEIAALKETAAQCEELRERLLRVQANYENSLKRLSREMQERADHALEGFAIDLLTVADHLALAIKAAREHDSVEKILEGVQLVEKQLYDAFARHGITPVSSDPGQAFDPNQHEALSVRSEPDRPPNVILDTVQRGFRLHKRLLRPARVIVNTGEPKADSAPSNTGEKEG